MERSIESEKFSEFLQLSMIMPYLITTQLKFVCEKAAEAKVRKNNILLNNV